MPKVSTKAVHDQSDQMLFVINKDKSSNMAFIQVW